MRFDIDDLLSISADFYKIFQRNTDKSHKLSKELEKYVIQRMYTFDRTENNCELTFRDWCLKNEFLYETKPKI